MKKEWGSCQENKVIALGPNELPLCTGQCGVVLRLQGPLATNHTVWSFSRSSSSEHRRYGLTSALQSTLYGLLCHLGWGGVALQQSQFVADRGLDPARR